MEYSKNLLTKEIWRSEPKPADEITGDKIFNAVLKAEVIYLSMALLKWASNNNAEKSY